MPYACHAANVAELYFGMMYVDRECRLRDDRSVHFFFFFILKTINRFLKASALKVRSPYMSCPYSAQIPRLFAHFRTQLPLKAFDVYCLRKVDLSNL